MALRIVAKKPSMLDPAPVGTVQREFQDHHYANPHVYVLLEQVAEELWNQGRRRAGARAMVEELRWNKRFRTTDPHFKLNDKHTPRYARLLLENHPEWEGLFELRALRADNPPTKGDE